MILNTKFKFDNVTLPDPADVRMWRQILDTYITENTKQNRMRKTFLKSFFNGGCSADGFLRHHEQVCGSCASEADARNLLDEALAAVCPSVPKGFPCRGWCGSEDAPDFCGVLDGLGVFIPSLHAWCARHDGSAGVERGHVAAPGPVAPQEDQAPPAPIENEVLPDADDLHQGRERAPAAADVGNAATLEDKKTKTSRVPQKSAGVRAGSR